MSKRPLNLERNTSPDGSPSILKRRRVARSQAPEGYNTSSLKGATPRTRARVLRANGETFAKRKDPLVVISDSSDEESHLNLPHSGDKSRTNVPSPMGSHISDSDTNESSLHSLEPLQKKRGAEIFSKKYDPGNPDFSESDDQSEHGKTTESAPRSGENYHHYPIQYLEAREKELEVELDEVKQKIVQSMEKELVIREQLIGTIRAISTLKNPATSSSSS